MSKEQKNTQKDLQYVKEINDYLFLKEIGKGQFGLVFLAVKNGDDRQVAIKEVKKKDVHKSKRRLELFKTEQMIMQDVDNDNVIQLLDDFDDDINYYLVMQMCEEGDLDFYWRDKKKKEGRKIALTEKEAVGCLIQILQGFVGLHEHNIIHRDLKLKNILVKDSVLKICDFGLSKIGDLTVSHVGTPYTKAPEVYKGKGSLKYGNKVDIWSLGIIFYQLLFDLTYPFDGSSQADLFRNIERAPGPDLKRYGVKISDDAQDLLLKMLNKDPEKRIIWSEIYTHQLIIQNAKNDLEQTQLIGLSQMYNDNPDVDITTLKCNFIYETLINTELLPRYDVALKALNTYYVQFYLVKELERTFAPMLALIPDEVQTDQEGKMSEDAIISLSKEQMYKELKENVVENLKEFIEQMKENNEEYEKKIVDSITHDIKFNKADYVHFLLSYYLALQEISQQYEDSQNYQITFHVLEHSYDILQCLAAGKDGFRRRGRIKPQEMAKMRQDPKKSSIKMLQQDLQFFYREHVTKMLDFANTSTSRFN